MTLKMKQARALILKRANAQRVSETLPPYQLRHLDRAVNRCRNLRLVKGRILIEAGFNEHGPNYRPGRPVR